MEDIVTGIGGSNSFVCYTCTVSVSHLLVEQILQQVF